MGLEKFIPEDRRLREKELFKGWHMRNRTLHLLRVELPRGQMARVLIQTASAYDGGLGRIKQPLGKETQST